mmetsp:Transcript_36875/g.50812  ORF Transcript_36875/g.50812 Transcript_36875/m.50812 type:complete len:243 (+) Transcript_36875:26-754(+)
MGALTLAVTTLNVASVCMDVYLGIYNCDTVENTLISFLLATVGVIALLGLDAIDHPGTFERIQKAMGWPLYIGCLIYELVFIFGSHYLLSYLVSDWNTEMTYLDLALTLAAVYAIDFFVFRPIHKTTLHQNGQFQHWIHHLPLESSFVTAWLFHPVDVTLEFIPGFSMVLAGLFITKSRMLYHTCYLIMFTMYNMEHDATLQLQHWHHHRLCQDYFLAYTRVSEKLSKDKTMVDVQDRMKGK